MARVYRERTLGHLKLSGWVPSEVFWQLARSQYPGPTLALARASSTVTHEPEATAAAGIQLWMAPLVQRFVYKRRSREYHVVRPYTLLRDPVGVQQKGWRLSCTRFF